MNTIETPPSPGRIQTRQVVHIALQLLALALLILFCYNVLYPFIDPVVWGGILAIAVYPLHQRFKNVLKGRSTLAATLITIAMLAILIVPSVWLAITTAGEIKHVVDDYHAGNITIPPPTEKVKDWPLVGNKAFDTWQQASASLDSLVAKNPAQVKAVAAKGLNLLSSTGKGLLLFAFAIIISGVFLSYATQAANFSRALFNRLVNSTKLDMASIAAVTVRNVVKGIIGVAFIQSALAAAGMIVGGVPYAGVWTLLCLILAIVQIGMAPVSIGVIIYIWSAGTTLTAILLTIWMLVVGLLDNVLKPLLMGKGAPVPMLVIFLGAIGGFIYSGFIGLFTGAVILSLGYHLFDIWLKGREI